MSRRQDSGATGQVTLFFGAHRAGRFVLSPEDSHHAVRVLRHEAADRVYCIDGSGTAFEVELDTLDPRAASGVVRSLQECFHEPRIQIELLCGSAQPARLDWVIEKATELGVHEIRPVRGSSAPGPGRVRRWSRIARQAAKQCRRGRVPLIHAPLALEVHLAELAPGGVRVWAEPGGGELPLPSPAGERTILAVGHDHGFSVAEKHSLESAGFQPVDLGSRRLRTETAVMVLLAWLARDWQVATRPSRSPEIP